MARIRTVKPEFWTSEQVVECCRDARLLFIGIWNFCDDGGVHPLSAKRLRMQIFPADDDITSQIILGLIDDLVRNGLVELYEVNGVRYLHATGWDKHQRIEKPNYRYPKPSAPGATQIRSTRPPGLFDERSPAEGNGIGVEEGNGMEGKDEGRARPREPTPGSDPAVAIIEAFDRQRAAVFGENLARPWPSPKDRPIAQRWIDAGADLPLCENVFAARFQRQKASGEQPSDGLAHMDRTVADAIATRARPMPAGNGARASPHDQGFSEAFEKIRSEENAK